jgi:hypothetical protein
MISEVSKSHNARYCRFYCLWNQVMQTTEKWLQKEIQVQYMHINSQAVKIYIKPCFRFFISDLCYEPNFAWKWAASVSAVKIFFFAKSSCICNCLKVTERLTLWMTQTGSCGLVKWITKMPTCLMMATARYIIFNLRSHATERHYYGSSYKPELQKTQFDKSILIYYETCIFNGDKLTSVR